MKTNILIVLALLLGPLSTNGTDHEPAARSRLLNGNWEVAEVTDPDSIPAMFVHHAPVPGLVDCSGAGFESPGLVTGKPRYYWYRTTFPVAIHQGQHVILKIHKAKYGTRVVVNGQQADENLLNFTATTVDISRFLRQDGGLNELLVRVGTHNTLPDTIPYGRDGEKFYYIPGIYDDVELTVVNCPYIQNVQVAPDPLTKHIRVKAEIVSDIQSDMFRASFAVREKSGGKTLVNGFSPVFSILPGLNTLDFRIDLPMARCWSPEDPVLYNLELATGPDLLSVTFGMRSFSFDPGRGMAVLNGVHRYLAGTNLAVLRFEEDSLRGNLPWDRKWVTRLHSVYKNAGMNIIRYTIGFPPDFWYDIADSLGILIQDEYPIWTGLTSREDSIRNGMSVLTREFTAWMRERWNHPSVVIWDANNESAIASTGEAIQAVRHMDLSDRPWDNGWGEPVSPTDAIESHPYFFIRFWDFYARLNGAYNPSDKGFFHDFFSGEGNPLHPTNLWNTPFRNNQPWPNAVINNEYEWLWLARDGTPTFLDSSFYRKYCKDCQAGDRFYYYARALAAATEYWRCNRKCAAVMYFVGLTYDRTRHLPSSTSDNFVNPATLEFEPNFAKHVLPAFQPVGLMINRWEDHFTPGQELEIPVVVINDLLDDWKGELTLSFYKEERLVKSRKKRVHLASMGDKTMTFIIALPEETGAYRMEAKTSFRGKTIISTREFTAKLSR
jgi:hypothetical protein